MKGGALYAAESGAYFSSLQDNFIYLRKEFSNSMDLMIREMNIGGNRVGLVVCEGMVDRMVISDSVIRPLLGADDIPSTPEQQFVFIRNSTTASVDATELCNFEDVKLRIMSGFLLVFVDGVAKSLAIGAQGFSKRSVEEPYTEVMEHGAKEGFVETLRMNISLIRKRLKSTDLRFESMIIGEKSSTEVVLCYLNGVASPKVVQEVKRRLNKVKLDMLLDSSFLTPFLDGSKFSIFSGVGTTERPDTLCGKLSEGRIGIIVDGTPFVLIVPYLFIENFQSFDDYCYRPYYATFLRWLKYISFFITVFLPGLYVAVGTYHQELFPTSMLFNIVASEQRTPFSLLTEALLIHVTYEIMRESGLRLPKPMGHAVSIIGGLVIGDATVSAGLIGAPMLIVVAITAISSFVVPKIYEPAAVLRLLLILAGGWFGIFGVTVGFILVIVNISSINPYGIPFSAPLSPFKPNSLRDVLVRASWKYLNNRTINVEEYSEESVRKNVK